MICRACLRRASALPTRIQTIRSLSTSSPRPSPDATASPRTEGTPSATSTGLAQPFTNPLSPTPNPASVGNLAPLPSKTASSHKKVVLPVSIAPAQTPLRGLNYLKGRDDPIALEESEYPEWLWSCLDKKVEGGEGEEAGGDEFSKSKKLRRAAAKRQRKLEEKLRASGDLESLQPKIPITRQSIDLPSGDGTIEGSIRAEESRREVNKVMRKERRGGIREANFLKGM